MDKSWKVALVFVALFAAGTACGVLIGLRWSKKPAPSTTIKQSGQTLEQFTRSQISTIGRRLKLTEPQREQIKPTIQKASEELASLRRRGFRETLEIVDRMNSEVDKLLTPEQRDSFADMRIMQRERMRTLMKGSPTQKQGSDKPPPTAPAKK